MIWRKERSERAKRVINIEGDEKLEGKNLIGQDCREIISPRGAKRVSRKRNIFGLYVLGGTLSFLVPEDSQERS